MTLVLLGQSGEGVIAQHVAAWIVALLLMAAAWQLSSRAPWRLLRQAAWALLVPAMFLAMYGTPPVWSQLMAILAAARQDAWLPLWSRIGPLAGQPLTWGLGVGALALWLGLPASTHSRRLQALACGVISLGFLAASTRWLGAPAPQLIYWVLAAVTLGAAAMSICMRSPVYTAIWFALSLLGVSGLFFYNGAQFLGAATIVVYAGAIIVTFLFVIMLAQPEGGATYDRISWATFPQPLSLLAGAGMVGALAFAISSVSGPVQLRTDTVYHLRRQLETMGDLSEQNVADFSVQPSQDGPRVAITLRGADAIAAATLQQRLAQALQPQQALVAVDLLSPQNDVLHPAHMAELGSHLFGEHMLSVELAGGLLLAALVGAITIVVHGRQSPAIRGAPGE